MEADVNSRRSYNSPLRADQARETRSKILDAAYRLFADRGYAKTTIAAVAEEAGVAQETIYYSVGSKRALLEGVIDSAIAGDDAERSRSEDFLGHVGTISDPAERLGMLVEFSCRVLVRTRPIHAVIRGAADHEAFAAAIGHRRTQDRLSAQTDRIERFLRDDLRPGLTVAEAGERYCALLSPELFYMLTVDLGWTPDQHRRWLTQVLRADLLATTPSTEP